MSTTARSLPFPLEGLEIGWSSGGAEGSLKTDLHVHSTFSDGRSTPEEIVERAVLKGYRQIAVVDHVRRSSDWLDRFADEMERLKRAYSGRIRLYSGIEAKVIDLDGNIDAVPEFFRKVDLVLAAFHRIPAGSDEYLTDDQIALDGKRALDCWFKAKMNVLENPHVHIIAHPTAILKRKGILLSISRKEAIARKAALCHKVFEINRKYQVPDAEFLHLLRTNGVRLCFGSDSHSADEL